jgi:hypothetical protein
MIVNVIQQFGASLTVVNYAPRVISCTSDNFIVQAMGTSALKHFTIIILQLSSMMPVLYMCPSLS